MKPTPNADRSLGEFEQIVLLAVLRLADQAYGVTILAEIAVRTARNPSPGALYTTLHRMEDKGLITFRDGSPTPERGGRAKRFVQLTREGRQSLASAQSAYRSLLEGLDLLPTLFTRQNWGLTTCPEPAERVSPLRCGFGAAKPLAHPTLSGAAHA